MIQFLRRAPAVAARASVRQGGTENRMLTQRNLRQKPRISYYEPEEPDLDEYVFCEKCGDYVYEYCSIHGPLLVIPDDKVPTNHNFPTCVPRAALTIPNVFLHLSHSIIPGAGLGVFTSLALPSGVRFGPYQGQRTDIVDSNYCWQIYDKNRKPLHCIDAADDNKSNWMRYVNCARHWREQNLVAYQYQGQLYYRTIKLIPRYTELMVFYGSEFACELDVDLGRYNSPSGYAQKYGAPDAKKRKTNDDSNIKTQREKENQPESSEHVETADKYVPETESIQVDEIKKSTIVKKKTKIHNKKRLQAPASKFTTPKQVIIGSKAKLIKPQNNGENKTRQKEKQSSKVDSTNKLQTSAKSDANTQHHPTMNDQSSFSIAKVKDAKDSSLKNEDVIKKASSVNLIANDPYHYCNECNKRYITKQELQNHLRFHDPNRFYVCKVCKLRFNTTVILSQHMHSHTKPNNYACQICDKKLNRQSHLKTHTRIHTGEKPYACQICDKKFNQQSHLKSHTRIHTGEKPYACQICDKKFNQQCNLKTHTRTHTGEKPYACQICDKTVTSNSHMCELILKQTNPTVL